MKKNVMMRSASLLLVMVLLTSSVISGTFAKYVTAKKGDDYARVAKFGVEITAIGKMFAKEYDTKNAADIAYVGAKSVVSTENVVAPGTSGELSAIAITGTPEVAVEVKYEATVDFGTLWVDELGVYYCPIEITIDGTTFKGTDPAYANIDAFEAAIAKAITDQSNKFPAGTTLEDKADCSVSISWAWAFEANDDVKDTFLGDQAADGEEIYIDIDLRCSVTQID